MYKTNDLIYEVLPIYDLAIWYYGDYSYYGDKVYYGYYYDKAEKEEKAEKADSWYCRSTAV